MKQASPNYRDGKMERVEACPTVARLARASRSGFRPVRNFLSNQPGLAVTRARCARKSALFCVMVGSIMKHQTQRTTVYSPRAAAEIIGVAWLMLPSHVVEDAKLPPVAGEDRDAFSTNTENPPCR